jgi:nucleotide-binding universal stress UspA family protein
MTTRTWLVAHDFSPCADAAADLALDDLSDSKRGGRIVLAHVFTVLVPPAAMEPAAIGSSVVAWENAMRTEATKALERVQARLAARAGPTVTVDIAVRPGGPAEGILEEARAQGAERIVVGTHGRRGVTHLLLGSVAERVARLAKVPVLVAHGKDGA